MNCPQCKSDNVQRFSVIYQSGTQNINTQSRSFGAGVGSGGAFGSAHTTTSGTSQSLMAKITAPPEKKSYKFAILCLIFGVLVMFVGSYQLVGFLLIGLGGLLGYFSYNYNLNDWPSKYQSWNTSWHCNKCGETYLQ